MHLLIDLQGMQTESRKRGIGRYAMALVKAIVRNAGQHQITALLNGYFHKTIPEIKDALSALLPQENILVFSAPGPRKGKELENGWRARAAELLREQMIIDIDPDQVLLTSLFEGPTGDAVTSIGHLPWQGRCAAILYDLIPYMDPAQHLGSPILKAWYYTKINHLKRADLLLAISDFVRAEAVQALGIPGEKVETIYSAADENFSVTRASEDTGAVQTRLGISRKFVMFASAFDKRKNFQGLVRAFGLLPENIRNEFQLVLVAGMSPEQKKELRGLAKRAGLREHDLILAGYVEDADLIALYASCSLFVFPSFQEGFGLPALEAMSCGAPAIGSNATSVPEVIGREDALFDPGSDQEMSAVIARALTDESFRSSLLAQAAVQATQFSWDRSATLALRALERLPRKPVPVCGQGQEDGGLSSLYRALAAIEGGAPPNEAELAELAQCIEANENTVRLWKRELILV